MGDVKERLAQAAQPDADVLPVMRASWASTMEVWEDLGERLSLLEENEPSIDEVLRIATTAELMAEVARRMGEAENPKHDALRGEKRQSRD